MKAIKKVIPIFLSLLMIVSIAVAESIPANADGVVMANPFPKFHGKDFDGNDVDNSMFKNNKITVLNLWFNGCAACVNEMPALDQFNKKLKEKGAEVVGVNVEAGENAESLAVAKDILAKQGVSYRNITIDGDQELMDYLAKIFAFPTTIIVDRNGNIIGDPIVGAIDGEKRQKEIMDIVDSIKEENVANNSNESMSVSAEEAGMVAPISPEVDAKDVASKTNDEKNNQINELVAKETEIIANHKEIWDKVFSKVDKSKPEDMEQKPYDEFLQLQIDTNKASFTEDELKTLSEDLAKIAEIEKQVRELSKSK